MDNSKGNTLIIHWISHREACAKQDEIAVRDGRSYYSDPTADEAIGRTMRDEKKKRRQQMPTRKLPCRPRIWVWRWEDEQRGASESAVKKGN